jgi:hypothetical protein
MESSEEECGVDIYIRPRFGYVEFVDAETKVGKEMAVAREMVGQRDSLDSTMAGWMTDCHLGFWKMSRLSLVERYAGQVQS